MTDKEAASEWGRERGKRRRQFDPAVMEKDLDHRKVKNPAFKHKRLQITMTPDGFAMLEAARERLNYGRGMSRSEFLEMTLRYYMEKRPEAHEARRRWRGRQENTQEGED